MVGLGAWPALAGPGLIAVGAGEGGGPHVVLRADRDGNGTYETVTDSFFFPYVPGFTGGVRVAAGDTDNSSFFVEVITVPGAGGGPHVRIFDDTGDAGSLLSDNAASDEFFAFDPEAERPAYRRAA